MRIPLMLVPVAAAVAGVATGLVAGSMMWGVIITLGIIGAAAFLPLSIRRPESTQVEFVRMPYVGILFGSAALYLGIQEVKGAIPTWVMVLFLAFWLGLFAVYMANKLRPWLLRISGVAFAGTLAAAAIFAGAVVAGSTLIIPTVDGAQAQLTAYSTATAQDIALASSQTDSCAAPTYYAYQAPAGSNNMGPAQSFVDASDGAARFSEKVNNRDLIWSATLYQAITQGRVDQASATSLDHAWASDCSKWESDMNAMVGNINTFSLYNAGGVMYESLGMIPGNDPSVMPTLTKFDTLVDLGQVLAVHTKDGRTVLLRVDCDLQISLPHIENVTPAKPSQPAPAPPEGHGPPPKPIKPKPTPEPTPTPTPSETPSTTPPPSSETPTTTPDKPTTTTTKPSTSTTTSTTSTTTTPDTSTTTTTTTTSSPPPSTTTTSLKPKETTDDPPPPVGNDTPQPSPSGAPETEIPVVTNPLDPTVTPGQEAPEEVTAPEATPTPTDFTPPPLETSGGAAPSEDPNTEAITRPGANGQAVEPEAHQESTVEDSSTTVDTSDFELGAAEDAPPSAAYVLLPALLAIPFRARIADWVRKAFAKGNHTR